LEQRRQAAGEISAKSGQILSAGVYNPARIAI